MSGAPERIVKAEPDAQAARERDDPEYAFVRSHEDFEADDDGYEIDNGS